jgi:hypothetical protein
VIWPIVAILIASGALLEPIELTVRVQNERFVEPRTMSHAQSVVGHIFATSGVKIRWTQDPSALRIQILNTIPKNLHDDTIGFSVLIHPGTSSYAVVSLPAAINVAAREQASLAMVLGASIAHELGHVVLGNSRHSVSGIMAARLDHDQLRMALTGSLLFSTSQSVELRSAVRQRRPSDGNWGFLY